MNENQDPQQLQKLIEEQKGQIERLKEKLELKERALSLLSHDIRGAIHNLSWVLDSLEKKEVPLDVLFALMPELRHQLQVSKESVENTLHWIQGTKDHTVSVTDVQVHHLYHELNKRLQGPIEAKGLQVTYEGDKNLIIRTDAYLVSFILLKILENAVKYSYEEGVIGFFGTSLGDGSVNLKIVDAGMGIENGDHLFTFDGPRYTGTRGEKGAGLSLIVVKELCDHLGITIDVRSESRMTTVNLMIPSVSI